MSERGYVCPACCEAGIVPTVCTGFGSHAPTAMVEYVPVAAVVEALRGEGAHGLGGGYQDAATFIEERFKASGTGATDA